MHSDFTAAAPLSSAVPAEYVPVAYIAVPTAAAADDSEDSSLALARQLMEEEVCSHDGVSVLIRITCKLWSL